MDPDDPSRHRRKIQILVISPDHRSSRSNKQPNRFLNALDRRYEPIKREILRLEPLPSTEAAYVTVRKEAAHQNILGETINETQGTAGLIAIETERLGLVSKVNRRSDRSQIGSSSRVDKSKLKCGECGMTGIPKKDALDLSATPTGGPMATRRAPRTLDQKKAKPLLAGAPKRTPTPLTRKISPDLGGWQRRQFTVKKIMDIKTGAIIGRGTEIKGLYYVDEVTQNGAVMFSHGTAEREAWLWHRRLGHPSNGYLHVLFPKLFPSN
nr:ribonuclease H-like domain-containing protein [Tanacetum cinerariifolium]